MAYIIMEKCTRDGVCLDYCPMDCIVPGQPEDRWPQYYIDPEKCIDCGVCELKCPVGAILDDADVRKQFPALIRKNAEFFLSTRSN